METSCFLGILFSLPHNKVDVYLRAALNKVNNYIIMYSLGLIIFGKFTNFGKKNLKDHSKVKFTKY